MEIHYHYGFWLGYWFKSGRWYGFYSQKHCLCYVQVQPDPRRTEGRWRMGLAVSYQLTAPERMPETRRGTRRERTKMAGAESESDV